MRNDIGTVLKRTEAPSQLFMTNLGSKNFVVALILSTVLFSSYLFSVKPQLMFFGDVAILYFPQFVEGYHLAKMGALVGIDFLTGNGSTAYFLRPNIPVYYPIYHLVYWMIPAASVETLARAFVFMMYAHSILATYYCIKIGQKYFSLTLGTSIFFAAMYSGAIAFYAFLEPPFYYVAALFPLLLYFSICSIEKSGWWRMVFHSLPYLMVFLSGYLPLAINAVMLALLVSCLYFWQNESIPKVQPKRLVLRFLAPFLLASAVVVPYYFAMYEYHKQVTGVAESVWSSAHQFSFQSKDIFGVLSRGFPSSAPESGSPFVLLGVIPAFVLILAFSRRKNLKLDYRDSNLVALSLAIFFFYFLLAFGQASGLPDLFYHLAPVIGRMHFYGRYLIVASFFFFLAVAIAFKYVIQIRHTIAIGKWLAGLSAILFGLVVLGQVADPSWINVKFVSVEFLMVGLLLVALAARQEFYAFAGVIGMTFLIHAANFNSFINAYSVSVPAPYMNDVAYSPVRREALLEYFKIHSKKDLIKYADLTAKIEKPNGVMLNFPWMVRDKVLVSNYMGYEPHMAVDRDYMDKYPYPYMGKINLPLLLRTGVDYVIYDKASLEAHAGEVEQLIDRSVPEHDIGFGYFAAKTKVGAGRAAYVPAHSPGDFDNGIVQISNSNGTVNVSGFETNFVSRLHFQVESQLPMLVRHMLFPSKLMELRIDGISVKSVLNDGLLEISLSPGKHNVEYRYKNPVHWLFTTGLRAYLLFIAGLLCWRVFVGIRLFGNFRKTQGYRA